MASIIQAALKPPSYSAPESQAAFAALLLPLYISFCVLSLAPLFLVEHPPVLDFANHSARLFLACNIDQPAVALMYEYRLGIIPNLALDLINWPLCGLVSPGTVVRGVTSGALVMIYVAGWVIQRKLFGQATPLLLMLPATAWNLVTTMGYSNYLVGVATTFLLIALTLGRQDRRLYMFFVCNLLGVAIFFAHIFALAFALIIFFGLNIRPEKSDTRNIARAALLTAVQFLVPLSLIVLVPNEGKPLAVDYSGKVRLIVSPFMTPVPSYDLLSLLVIVPIYGAIRERCLSIHPYFRKPLLLLAAGVVLIPNELQDAVDVDARLLVGLSCLFFIALAPIQKASRIGPAFAAISALLIGKPLYQALTSWRAFSAQVAEFRAAATMLPTGSSVLSANGPAAEDENVRTPVASIYYGHVASYATIDRRIFNPLEFTGVGMQPLTATARYKSVDTPAALPLSTKEMSMLREPGEDLRRKAARAKVDFAIGWHRKFDYVIYYHFGGRGGFDRSFLSEVHRGSFFSILRVQSRQGSRGPERSARHRQTLDL